MTGSIGKLAEDVLAEVRDGALTKLAEHAILESAEERAQHTTELGRSLSKMATILRSKSGGLTVEDLQTFLARLR
jgi:hypothetical protein